MQGHAPKRVSSRPRERIYETIDKDTARDLSSCRLNLI